MIEDYDTYDDEKPRVVDAISCTPMNEATVAFFKRVILTETSGSAVAKASRHLLNGLNLPRSSELDEQNYKYLVEELRSDDVDRKLRAFEKIQPSEELA